MPLVKLLASLTVLYVPARVCVTPGVLGRTSLERLCGSIAVSVIAAYLVHETVLLLGLRFLTGQLILLAVVVAGLANCGRKFVLKRPVHFDTGELKWFVMLGAAATWMLLLAFTQINFSGGGWGGDWLEQYQRMLFYVSDQDGRVYHGFDMTSRPPAFNVAAASLAQLIGSRFSDYQIVHVALGTVACVPALLLFEHFFESATHRKAPASWLALFGFSLLIQPMIVTNMLYPWSRMFTSFLMLAGVYYYLTDRFPFAFLCLGTAVASHYSTVVMLMVIAVHFLWSRRRNAAPWPLSIFLLGVPMLPWMLWGATTYGFRALLTTNAPAANLKDHGIAWFLQQWSYNAGTTFVPFIRFDDMRQWVSQRSQLGMWYDSLHLYWASTFWGSLTTAVTVTLMMLVVFRLARQASVPETGKRLVAISAVAICLNFLIVPDFEVSGVMHLSSQHIIIGLFALCLALIAQSPRWLMRVFGVLFVLETTGFYILKTFDRMQLPLDAYTPAYGANWSLKQTHHLSFLYDEYPQLAHALPLAFVCVVPMLYAFLSYRTGELQR